MTSLLNMRIYNCTVSELQHFVTQPILLAILRAVTLHVLILRSGHIIIINFKIENFIVTTHECCLKYCYIGSLCFFCTMVYHALSIRYRTYFAPMAKKEGPKLNFKLAN